MKEITNGDIPDRKALLCLSRNRKKFFKIFKETMNIKKGEDFKENQYEVIRNILKGRDCFVIMPTGSGKSACFQFPALFGDGLTIVIEPLIALMNDQIDSLQRIGIKAKRVITKIRDQKAHQKNMESIKKRFVLLKDDNAAEQIAECRLIYISPETFMSPLFINIISGRTSGGKRPKINMLVIDEAHCVSLWGNDFRPKYLRLSSAFRQIGVSDRRNRWQKVALTATATSFVREQTVAALSMNDTMDNDPASNCFGRDNLVLSVRKIKCKPKEDDRRIVDPKLSAIEDKYEFLVEDILNAADGCEEQAAVIVFCSERSTVELLYRRLSEDERLKQDFITAKYHGIMPWDEKNKSQGLFMQEKKPHRIMVATKAFGMGVDKDNIRLVIHFEISGCLEDYIQEVGRAGRDGRSAEAILYKHRYDVQKKERIMLYSRVEDYRRTYKQLVMTDRNKEPDIPAFDRQKLMNRLKRERFEQMLICAALAERLFEKKESRRSEPFWDKASQNKLIKGYIDGYLQSSRPLSDSEVSYINREIKNEVKWPEGLIICVSKPFYALRDGRYRAGMNECNQLEEGISFSISERVDLFDLMIACGVYTLYSNGMPSVSVKAVFQILTGDRSAAPEPDVREEIKKRIERMMTIEMTVSSEDRPPVSGRFIELEKKTGLMYSFKGPGALFEFTNLYGHQFILLPAETLKIMNLPEDENTQKQEEAKKISEQADNYVRLALNIDPSGKREVNTDEEADDDNDEYREHDPEDFSKAVDDTPYNILLKILLSWRINMLQLFGSTDAPRRVSRNIVLTDIYDHRPSIFRLMDNITTGVKAPGPEERSRTVKRIMEHYIQIGILSGYTAHGVRIGKNKKISYETGGLSSIERIELREKLSAQKQYEQLTEYVNSLSVGTDGTVHRSSADNNRIKRRPIIIPPYVEDMLKELGVENQTDMISIARILAKEAVSKAQIRRYKRAVGINRYILAKPEKYSDERIADAAAFFAGDVLCSIEELFKNGAYSSYGANAADLAAEVWRTASADEGFPKPEAELPEDMTPVADTRGFDCLMFIHHGYPELCLLMDEVCRILKNEPPGNTDYSETITGLAEKAVKNYEKRLAENRKLDLDKIEKAFRDAAVARELLLTEEDVKDEPLEEPEEPLQDDPVQDSGLLLEEEYIELLNRLLNGEETDEYIKANYIITSVAAERINSALGDGLGDFAVEEQDGRLFLTEDYIEGIKNILGG